MPAAVTAIIKELQEKGVVKAMDHGAYTRVAHQDTQIQVSTFDFRHFYPQFRIVNLTPCFLCCAGCEANADDGEFEAADYSYHHRSILRKTCG